MKNKKFIIAPDSFKESMTAKQASHAIERGFRSIFQDSIDLELIPMADGGEGTTQALINELNSELYQKIVTDPLGGSIKATYAISEDRSTAVIEMAESSGLMLIPVENRNPMITTSYGTGELIKAALDHGVAKVILGIGGSATNDGGAGMIKALGGVFYSQNKQKIDRGGQGLINLNDIDISNIDTRLKEVEIIVACDVNNPLLGSNGASVTYGPQKGANDKMIADLDEALHNFNHVVTNVTGKDVKNIPGAGAAGGLGASLLAFLNAKLKTGIEVVLNETNFHKKVMNANLVITGEGKIDGQTTYGKTPIGVAKASKQAGVNVIAFCGSLGNEYEKIYEHGINAVFSIVKGPEKLEDSLLKGPQYLESLAANVAEVISLSINQ